MPTSREDGVGMAIKEKALRTAIVAQELYPRIAPLLGVQLEHLVLATYSDYLKAPTELAVPDFISAVAGLFTGQRAGHNRSKTNSFRTVALTASRIVKMLTRGTPPSDTVTPEYLHPNLWALFETPPLAQFREAR